MTDSTTPPVEVRLVDPTALTTNRNIRRDLDLDDAFRASIRQLGVLSPIVAETAADGALDPAAPSPASPPLRRPGLHDEAPTQEGVRGTAWGVLQAAWEFDGTPQGNRRGPRGRSVRGTPPQDDRSDHVPASAT